MKKHLRSKGWRLIIANISYRISLAMKLTVFFLMTSTFLMGYSYTGFGQEEITLQISNGSISDVIDEIETSTPYAFVYRVDAVDLNRRVSIRVKNTDIGSILNILFAETQTEYNIRENQIILTPRPRKPSLTSILPSRVPEFLVRQVRIDFPVSGRVIDQSGQALIGVNVTIKGSAKGTATDIDGRFSLEDVHEQATLVFSYVGYHTQEIALEGRTNLTVIMLENVQTLDEVVVVGYGTVKKSDLTGSVASVKSEELNAFPSNNLIQALQGRAAGVQILADNGGEPGGDYNIMIRGSSSINASSAPLYVVDGFPQGTLPPAEDIASIEILKDASATAIYGSRGANGVVVITTKKGSAGEIKVNLKATHSIQNEVKRLDLLNASQFAELINTINAGIGQPPAFPNPSSLGVGTDWQDEIFQTGNIQNYNLSISGGHEKVKYYVSGVYYDQKGIIINSGYKRYSLTANLALDVTDKIRIGLNLLNGRNDQNRLFTQEGSGGGVLSTALIFPPSEGIYNDDGTYTVFPFGEPLDNPVALAYERPNNILSDYMQMSASGEVDLLPSLTYRAFIGLGNTNRRAGNYTSTNLIYGETVGGIASVNNSKNSNIIAENYLTFSRDYGQVHALTVMAGHSHQSFSSESATASGSSFLTNAGIWWNLGGASTFQQPNSSLTDSKLTSVFGRINYSLMQRYLITINTRYDGSSRFALNNKWAFFPSGAFAWNIANEGFMEDSRMIDLLKLRVSYGVTGNQAISPYQSLANLRYVFAVDNGQIVNAVSQLSVANNDLTWESTAQTDLGLDIGMFSNRIHLNVDYYNKITSDLLFDFPLPTYTGYTSQLKNIGKVGNSGFEIALQLNDIVKAVRWNSKINISFNRNEILELPEGKEILYRSAPGQFVGIQTSQVIREGEPLGMFYGLIYEGVQQEGDPLLEGAEGVGGERFRDLNNDGILNDLDRTIIGNPHPDFYFGWNNEFSFKNFDLNIFVHGVQGNDMLNYTRMGLESLYSGTSNATTEVLNSWTPDNTQTNIPKVAQRGQKLSTRWVEDGSFVRLENVSLGYSFPGRLLTPVGLSSLRLYVSGQKLFTITGYKGFDPEVSWSSGNRNLGLDYGSFPNVRNFTFGLTAEF